MVFLSYGLLVVGLIMLVLDIVGSFRADRRDASVARLVGLLLGAVAGLLPLALVIGGWSTYSDSFLPAIAIANVVLFGLFAVGVAAPPRNRGGVWLSRVVYLGWVVLAAIPSFVLLPITAPFVGLAGLALCRNRA